MPNYCYNGSDHMQRGGGRSCREGRTRQDVKAQEGCREEKRFHIGNEEISDLPLAMAYVPMQRWRDIYEVKRGFFCGTIFEQLNKPFRGREGNC